jgi:hypothetical protein
MLAQNHFCGAKSTFFNFSSSDFNLQQHILTTTGVALTKRDPPHPMGSIHKKPKLASQLRGEQKQQISLEILLSN